MVSQFVPPKYKPLLGCYCQEVILRMVSSTQRFDHKYLPLLKKDCKDVNSRVWRGALEHSNKTSFIEEVLHYSCLSLLLTFGLNNFS